MALLTLAPDRFAPTRPLHRKLVISADSSLIRQKIGIFFRLNDAIKGWLA